MALGNPFFKLEDFHSMELSVTGSNVTSGVDLPAPIHLIELHNEGITIELAPRSCADGHMLALDIQVKRNAGNPEDETVHVPVVGVINEFEVMPDSRLKVRLKFRRFPQDQWQSLINYLSEKQGSLNALLRISRK